MARSDIFGDSSTSNTELKNLADFAHKCAVNTAKAQSGGQQIGLDAAAMERQVAWLANAKIRLGALASAPDPDVPAMHPKVLPIHHPEPDFHTVDGIPINPDAEAVAVMWQTIAYELTHSTSTRRGGSLHPADSKRCAANLDALGQFLETVALARDLDFPETAADAVS